MIKTTNNEVAGYWARGQRASNSGGTFSTDGNSLFSYNLEIGYTENGKKILKDYTAGTALGMRSQTTSCHVGKSRMSADMIFDGVILK